MNYLHGYSDKEAARLRHQAAHLARWLFRDRPLRDCKRILEVGSGVGGQTALLLDAYPEAHITAVEREASSHAACLRWLASSPGLAERVTPVHADALALPPTIGVHDGTYICWVLEHSEDPVALLRSVRDRLSEQGRLLIFEVFNQSFLLAPQMPPKTAEYSAAFDQLQTALGGDPNAGAQLGQMLHLAGFRNVQTTSVLIQLDDREPELRQRMCDFMAELLLSANEQLVRRRVIAETLGPQMRRELRQFGRTPGSVFNISPIRGDALR